MIPEHKQRSMALEVHYSTVVEMLQILVHNKNISKEAYDILLKHLRGVKTNVPNFSDFIEEIQSGQQIWEIEPNSKQPVMGHSLWFGAYILKVVPHSPTKFLNQNTCP